MANNFAMIRSKIRRLPGIHQATLRAMLEHLAKVSANQKSNKMDAKNLAVVFGPVLLGEEAPVAGLDILTMPKVGFRKFGLVVV
jgi:Rho GTPase-activating protein 12/27